MKKFLMFVAFAAMCVTANAQEVKMTSYADEDMVFQYPADWKPTENTREDVAFEGKDGVSIGFAIIPGVLCISTIVMMLTFGAAGENGEYLGVAYEGVPVISWAANKINFIFDWLFGFKDGALISFPMTALGAVGAAIGLVPRFITEGIIDNNAIAVFTAIGMCWSGFLSTHAAMLDSLGYRKLIGKAIGAHTIGGLCAGIAAHWLYVLLALIF